VTILTYTSVSLPLRSYNSELIAKVYKNGLQFLSLLVYIAVLNSREHSFRLLWDEHFAIRVNLSRKRCN